MVTWGPAQYDGSSAFRLGYDLTQSPATVGAGTSSVTVTLKLYFQTRWYAYQSSTADWSITGDFSGSGSFTFNHDASGEWSGSNVTLVATRTRTVAPSYAGYVRSTFAASLSGVVVVPGKTGKVSGSWDTAQRPISAPAAPTGCGWARVSDTQHTVSWSNTSPTSASNPYQNVDVYRSTNDGPLTRIAILGGTTTSYSDRGTSANKKYRYAVRARNTAGSSAAAESTPFATTPAAPTSVTATKAPGGDIAVSWTDQSPYNTAFEVWDKPIGGALTLLATIGNVSSYTHVDPDPTKVHQYAVRARTSAPALVSAYSTGSNTVQLAAPPNAPTSLSPSGVVRDGAAPIALTWRHNPVDTTAQTKHEVQWRPASRTNTVANPSFETDTAGWGGGGGAVLTRDAAGGKVGPASLKVATPAVDGYVRLDTVAPAASGQTWTGSAWFKGTGTVSFRLCYRGASYEELLTVAVDPLALTGDWQQVAVTGYAPPGTARVMLYAYQADDGAQAFNMDAVMLEQSWLLGTYIEGTSSSAWTSLGVTTSTLQSRTLAAGTWANGRTFEWQVRTWGQHANPSPWSSTAIVTTSTRPLATIVTPAAGVDVATSQLIATWGFYDAEGNPQAQWQARLYNAAGTLLETRTGVGAATEATFSTGLVNGGDYSVGVKLQDSTGLWSDEQQQTFHVVFALPPKPGILVQWLPDSAAVAVSVTNPPTAAGQVDALTVRLFRLVDGESEWSLIADAMPLQSAVTDLIPPLGVLCWYKAVAISALPSTAESDPSSVVTERSRTIVVNAGAGFGQSAHLQHNIELAITSERQKSHRRFAGRTSPVEFVGEQRGRTLTVTCDLFRPWALSSADLASTLSQIEDIADLPAPACLRDPDGRRYFVSMDGLQVGTGPGAVHTLSWKFVEVDWREPLESEL